MKAPVTDCSGWPTLRRTGSTALLVTMVSLSAAACSTEKEGATSAIEPAAPAVVDDPASRHEARSPRGHDGGAGPGQMGGQAASMRPPRPLPPAGAPPGMLDPAGAPEDPAESWREALFAPVPRLETVAECPDQDGDGFGDAFICPHLPPELADCDDKDPKVTPDLERFVRPGPFLMGSASTHAGQDEKPVHRVTLSGFCLDRTTVTRAAMEKWRGREIPEGESVLPADDVTWDEARDFCAQIGKILATEAQWEKAARGGCEYGQDPNACDPGDIRPYPWGTEAPSCDRANHRETVREHRLCEGRTIAAGTPLNEGPYGHIQMAGNVWEWVADAYHPKVYREEPPRVDPTGPAGGDLHVLRGGAWNTFSTNMRVANRMSAVLEGSITGFRCARSSRKGIPDPVAPLRLKTISGKVVARQGALSGRALYVTAFDAAYSDPATGRISPGHSPAAEVKLVPNGTKQQAFSLRVPEGGAYVVMAALDAAEPPQPDGSWAPPSSTGGVGQAGQNPIRLDEDVAGVVIHMGASPPRAVAE